MQMGMGERSVSTLERPLGIVEAGSEALPAGYDLFRLKLKKLTGIDLSAYKSRQMQRRLTNYLKRVEAADFFALAKSIERDADALERLKDFLTINVSEFFRNPERYDDLERRILPELLEKFKTLKIWSAGCSIGAEPYSLSILLEEVDPGGSHDVIGTDIDAKALEAAVAGVYHEDKLREVSKARRRFFHPTGDGAWRIDPLIQRRVRFEAHDLLNDPYPQGVHLILCRNVVIYFTDEAKARVFRGFSEAMAPGGYLMIGSTESIFNSREFGLRPAGPFVYQKSQDGRLI